MISAPSSARTQNRLPLRVIAPYAVLTPLYDALLGDRFFPYLRRAFEWLAQRYGIGFASAADMACGTGTFVRYLCERGVPVVYGVDRSPEMLRLAMAKNRSTSARFLLQDFANLQLPHPIDLITCNFDSLNYLLGTGELLKALRRFHANLKPGGHVIFDMISQRPPWLSSEPRVEHVTGPGVMLVRVMCWDSRGHIQTSFISITRHGRTFQESHRQRGYPVALVAKLLAQAKFTLLGIHDFMTFGPVTAWTARAVYVAYK